MEWPTTVEYTTEINDTFDTIVKQVTETPDGKELDIDTPTSISQEFTGEGRVVFDTSAYTTFDTVLKVPYNDYGLKETRFENIERKQFPPILQERTAPVLDIGQDHSWIIQPKCDNLPQHRTHNAVSTLMQIVEETGYNTAEIYPMNIGLWNDTPVLFDYGSL